MSYLNDRKVNVALKATNLNQATLTGPNLATFLMKRWHPALTLISHQRWLVRKTCSSYSALKSTKKSWLPATSPLDKSTIKLPQAIKITRNRLHLIKRQACQTASGTLCLSARMTLKKSPWSQTFWTPSNLCTCMDPMKVAKIWLSLGFLTVLPIPINRRKKARSIPQRTINLVANFRLVT